MFDGRLTVLTSRFYDIIMYLTETNLAEMILSGISLLLISDQQKPAVPTGPSKSWMCILVTISMAIFFNLIILC